MIHVDVKRRRIFDKTVGFLIETSVDGSAWHTHYEMPVTVGDDPEKVRQDAEHKALVFAHGIEFAGQRVRVTSCGYHLKG